MTGHIAIVGDYRWEHCTAQEYALAFADHGFKVHKVQEGIPRQWPSFVDDVRRGDYDFVVWNSTPSLARYLPGGGWDLLNERGDTPVISVHLDQHLGLAREADIAERPDFAVDVFFGTEGGQAARWTQLAVVHRWLLPAIGRRWLTRCPMRPVPRFAATVGFVGTQGGYHAEWPHRTELVDHLRSRHRAALWPRPRGPRIIGTDLSRLAASVKVMVGDSLALPGIVTCSDRIPELLGRGAILVHPHIDGITGRGDPFDAVESGLATWDLGDWDQLDARIESLLNADRDEIAARRQRAHEFIAEHHTYHHRVDEILAELSRMGLT